MCSVLLTQLYSHVTFSGLIRIILALIFVVSGMGSLASMSPAVALPIAEARHLLARTELGLPRPDEIVALAHMSRVQAVDDLLRGVRSTPGTEPPAWVNDAMPAREIRETL